MAHNVFDRLNDDYYKNTKPFAFRSKDPETHRAYSEEEQRLSNEFYEDAIDTVGLTGHPKASAAFNLAWEERHSSGRREVAEFLRDVAELLK